MNALKKDKDTSLELISVYILPQAYYPQYRYNGILSFQKQLVINFIILRINTIFAYQH